MKDLTSRWRYYLFSPSFLLLKIIFDRIFFFLFYKSYYQRIFRLYGENVRWGRDSKYYCIPSSVRVSCPHLIEIADDVQIDEGTYLQCHDAGEGISIGHGVRINHGVHIQSFSKIIIEDFVLIAPSSVIVSGNHTQRDSQTPIMSLPYNKSGPIKIGRGCWLGHGAKIMGGVELGQSLIVAAGAVVTKSFTKSKLIGGVPAKEIKAW